MYHVNAQGVDERIINVHYYCNRVYCIHVPGHDPLIFSFLSFILFDWVGVLWPQLSKVLKLVRWAGSVRRLQARSKDQEILEGGGGAGPSNLPRRDNE